LQFLLKSFPAQKCYGFFLKNLGKLLLLCGLLFSNYQATAQTAFKFTEGRKKQKIAFQLHRNLIIIKAKLNGKGPFNFLLDTGINTSLITDAGLSDSVKFSRGPNVEIAGAGSGSDLRAFYTPDLHVAMPGIVSENITFAVLSEDVLQLGKYVGLPVTGILGYDFFSSFVTEVDFKNLKLNLYEPQHFSAPKAYHSLPLQFENNKPYVQATLRQESLPVKLLLDTGAGHALSLETGSDEKIKVPEPALRAQLGVGLAGPVNGFIGRVGALQLSGYELKSLIASFPDAADVQAKVTNSRHGTLGLELLKRFKLIFDYPHSKLYLKRRYNLQKPFEYDMCGLDLEALAPSYRTYRITGVHPASPAFDAGILPGDELIALDLVPISAYNLTQINRMFHTQPGRNMLMVLKREGQLYTTTVTLKRRI
jgi:hypothetical protein